MDFFGVLDLIKTSGDAFVVYCAVDLGWGQLSLEVEVDIVVEEDSLRRHRFPEGLPAMFSNCRSRLTLVPIPSEKVDAYKLVFIFMYIEFKLSNEAVYFY